MRKFLFLLFISILTYAQLSGVKYVGATGTKPGGDPDYSDFQTVFNDIMTNGLSGDLTLLVTSDLNFSTSQYLAKKFCTIYFNYKTSSWCITSYIVFKP